jgi:hypothetical protein
LRIVAQRRQLVVPSLFADFDADALARRLIPLSESTSGQGLSALPLGEKYELESQLRTPRHEVEAGGSSGETKELAAIAAASEVEE